MTATSCAGTAELARARIGGPRRPRGQATGRTSLRGDHRCLEQSLFRLRYPTFHETAGSCWPKTRNCSCRSSIHLVQGRHDRTTVGRQKSRRVSGWASFGPSAPIGYRHPEHEQAGSAPTSPPSSRRCGRRSKTAAHIPAHGRTRMRRKTRRCHRTPPFAPVRTTLMQPLRRTRLPRCRAMTRETLRNHKTEGTGFEPATPFGASDFESDR